MPYVRRSGRLESARSIGHVPIVENELIKERLRSWRIHAAQSDTQPHPALVVPADQLGTPGEPIRWVMSFDGSPQEVPVQEKYPSTRVGYVQIAAVLVNLRRMLGQETRPLVDPAVIRSAVHQSLSSMVLPCSNVCRPDLGTVKDSWRAEVFEIFRDYSVEDSGLLDVFMLLVSHSDKRSASGGVVLNRCSVSDACNARAIDVPRLGTTCPSCGGMLYPTDALRIHEEVLEEHPNLTALGRLMTCLEHIVMMACLSFLYQRQPRVLGYVGFILDGPLALFGPQAWLHTALLAYIHKVNGELTRNNLRCPVLLGVEKTGQFAEHAADIADHIPPRSVMMLPDEYIYDHILTFRPPAGSRFGRDTYYGQKFFYQTAQGQLLTITVPKIEEVVADEHHPAHYPCLPNTLALLDRVGTNLYEDALIPVALAHSFASIPLRIGSKVLAVLSRELLGQAGSEQ